MPNLPILLFLIGIPGSGKSSWLFESQKEIRDGGTYTLVKNYPFHIVCPDAIRQKMGDISDQSQNTMVWQEAKEQTVGCLVHGTNVILDATNVNTQYRRSFLSDLPMCRKWAKLFPVEPDVAWERIKKDLSIGKQRANVPEDVLYRMYGEYLYTVKAIKSEGIEVIQ
jgi:predicted kinase